MTIAVFTPEAGVTFAGVNIAIPDEQLIQNKDVWSYLVKCRDGFKCQDCGGDGTNGPRGLESHHIDRNRKNNRLANGITLCNECHMLRHLEENRNRTRRRNLEGLARSGGQAVKKRWADQTPEERAALIARIGKGRYCEPGCTCKRHLKPRQTHCKRGHPLDEANTYVDTRGRHYCRMCRNAASRAEYARRKRKEVGA